MLLVAVAAAALGAFTYLQRTEPAWWARIWYPLKYQAIVRGHAAHYSLEPGAARGGDRAGEQVQRGRALEHGRDRADAAPARHGEGHRDPHGRHKFVVSDLDDPEINVRYGAWYLRHLLDKYHDERLALAAYNAGQANVDEWQREGRGHPVPRDARVRRPRREAEGHLPPRVRVGARARARRVRRGGGPAALIGRRRRAGRRGSEPGHTPLRALSTEKRCVSTALCPWPSRDEHRDDIDAVRDRRRVVAAGELEQEAAGHRGVLLAAEARRVLVRALRVDVPELRVRRQRLAEVGGGAPRDDGGAARASSPSTARARARPGGPGTSRARRPAACRTRRRPARCGRTGRAASAPRRSGSRSTMSRITGFVKSLYGARWPGCSGFTAFVPSSSVMCTWPNGGCT